MRASVRPLFRGRLPVRIERRVADLASRAVPVPATGLLRMELDGVPCQLLLPPDARPDRTVVFLHGGGPDRRRPGQDRNLPARLALRTSAPTFVLDSRRAADPAFPGSLGELVCAYRHLLAGGRQARQIVLIGDGAAGGLCLAAVHALRDVGVAPPAALILLSPWLDLTLSGESVATEAAADPVLSRASLAASAQEYAGGLSADHPGCSPLFGDQRGLPPILVQVGAHEILRSDADRLAAAAPAVEIEIAEDWWHRIQHHAGLLPAADRALTSIVTFAERAWAEATPAVHAPEEAAS